jgi:outer membrane immunogenic protein
MVGWAGGAGMEVGLTPNWSAKVEYLYMDLGNRTFAITGNGLGLHSNYLRFGVNYHF